MRFKGRLRFDDSKSADLDVVVEVDDSHVRLTSGDESLGRWCLADVVANRRVANEFDLDLDGESVVFLAEDQVNFAYGAVQKMAEGWARFHSMNPLRRRRAVAAARRHNEPSRLNETQRTLVAAREELRRLTSVEIVDEPAVPEDAQAPASTSSAVSTPDVERRPEGFWARVERATLEEPTLRERFNRSSGRLPRPDPLRAAPPRPVDPESNGGPESNEGHGSKLAPMPRTYSKGRHPAETTGLRASLRSLFSRSTPAPHEHSFVQTTTVGITRSVCIECGHVSIGVEK